ncbi:MAG: Permease of the drug/metabolite transporter (DMT) superfamily [Candidatus Ozemobacter sibiricus]|jgi:drug/metabolite transporter (DMT)-like permease|uniref:Permease of the drug/metabolite transporter (DMT) superfamily n=1 Tax=Candidatus Ozemobacter sibiricus TaxID=2268124 RepID=A0A367ZPQ0_9BACT|nr:MAG: Permease of the drug/metabolite transporter (DMT) superfamily [Candidatus Ozemobacter sibiricus]
MQEPVGWRAWWARGRLPFLLAFTVVAFSAIEVVANPIRHRLEPAVMTFWRFLLGVACLVPAWLAAPRREPARLSLGDLLRLWGLGGLNIIVAMGAHAVCIKFAKASTAAILIAANPLATNLFAWLLLGEPMGWRRLVALLIGFAGVTLVAARPTPGADTPFGIAMGLVGLTGFALYTVLSKGIVQRLGSLRVTVLSFTLGVATYLPILLWLDLPVRPPADLWPRLLVLGVVVSGLGYITFFKALAALPAGRTSLLFFCKPPVAIGLAWAFLGEQPVPAALAGTVLVMFGIAFDRTPGPPDSAGPTTKEDTP